VSGAWAPEGKTTGAPSSVRATTLGAPRRTVTSPCADIDCCVPGARVCANVVAPLATSRISTQQLPVVAETARVYDVAGGV